MRLLQHATVQLATDDAHYARYQQSAQKKRIVMVAQGYPISLSLQVVSLINPLHPLLYKIPSIDR